MHFSPYTGTTYTVSSSNCPSFSCATSSSLLMLTVEPSFVHGLEKTHRASFLNRVRNSRCTVITDLDTSKQSTQKAFSCCDAILETWLHSKHEKRTAGNARETWTLAAADGVRCARVRWEMNFLLTSETATFFCVYPVYATRCNVTQFIFYFRFFIPCIF